MKKRLLFVIESLSGGGAEKVLSVLLKFFDYNKYQITICPIVDTGIYCEEVKQYVDFYSPIISYHGNFIRKSWNKIKYKLIYSILPLRWVYWWFIPKNNDVEIAFCEGFVTKLFSQANSKSKKIAWIHTDLAENPWPIQLGIYKEIEEERNAYSCFDKIVCVSHTVENSFHTKYGLKDLTVTIYNPIDVKHVRDSAGVPLRRGGDVNVISIGRLVPQKGYDRLLRVAKRLHDEHFNFQMQIVGEGSERDVLEKYVSDNAMESYVSLPGFSLNPYEKLVNSDLFVCASYAEGFSLVIAEAILLGIPVISTYCSGPNELLNEDKFGELVENSDEGLYEGMKCFFAKTTKRTHVDTDEFENKFRADNIVREVYKLL